MDPSPRVLSMAGPARHLTLAGRPGVAGQFARALRGRGRPRGLLDAAAEARLGPVSVELLGARLDPVALDRFRAVCGYPGNAGVPSAFCETLFQGLLVELVLSDDFPLAAFGLVHLRQRLTAHRAISPAETLDLRCRLVEVRATARGVELDCAMEALAGGAPAWDGLATLLSRALAQRAPAAPRPVGPEAPGGWSEPLVVDVPASTGRRYARASGDYNPFHLHALLARPFGFPRAIAHGMWTLAWALAHLRDPLPDAHTVEATFRKPVLMPARIALRDRTTAAGREVEVRDAAEDLLHLSAALR